MSDTTISDLWEDAANGRNLEKQSNIMNVERLIYKILRDMMIEEELDYDTYKRFTERFEAELKRRENEPPL